MSLTARKLGNFSIEAEIIETNPEVVRAIMGKLIVVRAEMIFATKCVDYVAICDDYDELEEGEATPNYDVMYDSETGDVAWVREA